MRILYLKITFNYRYCLQLICYQAVMILNSLLLHGLNILYTFVLTFWKRAYIYELAAIYFLPRLDVAVFLRGKKKKRTIV